MRILGRIGVVLACVLVLTACGSENQLSIPDAPSTPEIIASPPTESTPVPPMVVGDIIWTTDITPETGEPMSEATMFYPRSPVIIATIHVTSVPAGTDFTATWTVNDQPFPEGTMTITTDRDWDDVWLAFGFNRAEDELYPLGQVGVTITTDTGAIRESSVKIGLP